MNADEWAAFVKGLVCGAVGLLIAFGILKWLTV